MNSSSTPSSKLRKARKEEDTNFIPPDILTLIKTIGTHFEELITSIKEDEIKAEGNNKIRREKTSTTSSSSTASSSSSSKRSSSPSSKLWKALIPSTSTASLSKGLLSLSSLRRNVGINRENPTTSSKLRKTLIPLTSASSSALASVLSLSRDWKKEELAMRRIRRREEKDIEFEKEIKDREQSIEEEKWHHHFWNVIPSSSTTLSSHFLKEKDLEFEKEIKNRERRIEEED